MASMTQYCLRVHTSWSKSSNTLSMVQPCNNARHLSNLLLANIHSSPKSTFPQLSLAAKKYQNVAANSKGDQWRVWCIHDQRKLSRSASSLSSLQILIQGFFNAINLSEEEQLEKLLAKNCEIDDLIFRIPLGEKQRVLDLLCNLTDALGPDIDFHIDNVDEENHLNAIARWHLEWKHKKIPLTSGCSLFECEEVDEEHRIRKITGALKPGDFVLKFLKATRVIFEQFPDEADVVAVKKRTDRSS